MRLIWLALMGLTLPASAWAQRLLTQAAPLPPFQQQWQQSAPPVQRPPVYPGTPGQARPGQNAPGQSPSGQSSPPPAGLLTGTAERPNVWLPAQTAKLQALDKVNAQATSLTIKVGQSATFGSLTITAKACLVRPADQPADAAAYLAVTDGHPDSPGFNGWMLADEPSVSMMQHPIYDLRVTGCT